MNDLMLCAWCDSPAMAYSTHNDGSSQPSCGNHGFNIAFDRSLFLSWLASHDALVRAEQREQDARIIKAEIERLEVVKGTYAQGQRHVLGLVWAAIRAGRSEQEEQG